jgi:hypothetical protein
MLPLLPPRFEMTETYAIPENLNPSKMCTTYVYFHSPFVPGCLKNVKRKMETQPNDYIRINIRHPSLDSDIWIEFTQSKHLTEEKILQKIQSVQQSKKEFVISDGGTQLDIFHVKYPEGSGGNAKKHLHLDKEMFKRSKQAIVQIVNPWDFLCLPRALVVARLHAQKPEVPDPEWKKKWKRMRLGDTQALEQKRQAVALMEEAGCETTQPCGPEEWSKLQRTLALEFRLKIFQFKVNTRRLQLEPVYKGWGHGTCLNVLYDNQHYDAMPGVTEHPYYCDYCDVAYRNIKNHRTTFPHRCSFCLADTPYIPDGTSIECAQCHGYFRNMECYQNHLKPYSTQTSTSMCHLMGRCDQCQKLMSKKLLKGHACSGNIQCKICKKSVPMPHHCFVQVKPKEEQRSENVHLF